MARSKFRYNKKRKHYAYLFKDIGTKRANILISSKPLMVEKKHNGRFKITTNVQLHHHPNIKKSGVFYVIPKKYIDELKCFDVKIYKWKWNKHDKRKIKRIKKLKKVGYDTTKAVNHQLINY